MVYTFLNSPKGQKQLWEESAGSGRQNLSAPGLESISLPLPPLSEQTEIVRQVELRQKAADRLAATLDRQLTRARATRQSLLREAFAGNLVPQDPKDEPASALLDRIRLAREAEAKKPKTKRMPKSKFKLAKRPLLEVLREHKKPMTAENLFRESGYDTLLSESDEPQDVVDAFYSELRELTARPAKIAQERDSKNHVLLRALS
jgi:type I restriction enzyme S subunit